MELPVHMELPVYMPLMTTELIFSTRLWAPWEQKWCLFTSGSPTCPGIKVLSKCWVGAIWTHQPPPQPQPCAHHCFSHATLVGSPMCSCLLSLWDLPWCCSLGLLVFYQCTTTHYKYSNLKHDFCRSKEPSFPAQVLTSLISRCQLTTFSRGAQGSSSSSSKLLEEFSSWPAVQVGVRVEEVEGGQCIQLWEVPLLLLSHKQLQLQASDGGLLTHQIPSCFQPLWLSFSRKGLVPFKGSYGYIRLSEDNLPSLANYATEHNQIMELLKELKELYKVWVFKDHLRILPTTLGLPPLPNSTATSLP